jgi:hypothetical protein
VKITFEIEKILDKRKENNEIQYLVKWKSFSSDHNEWVPESQFSDFKKINEFNNSFYPKDDQQTTPLEAAASTGKRRGRPPKTLVSPNQLPFIMMIIFLLLPFIIANEKSFKIKGNFNYCDKSKTSMIKLDSNCLTYKQTIVKRPKFPEFTFTKNSNTFVSIISKRRNTVFGKAFECKISEQKTILKSDFWSRNISSS